MIDDHLLRDVLAGERAHDLDGLATSLATTGLWLFRLSSALASPEVVGKLSAPVLGLSPDQRDLFVRKVVSLPEQIQVLSMRELAWPMALLQRRHQGARRPLSAVMAEALAAAQSIGASIAVSTHDVGPNLMAAADSDGVPFHVV